MIRDFRAALAFLTVLPLGRPHDFSGHRMVAGFPLVGLLLGVLVAFCDLFLCRLFSTGVVSLIDVLLLAVLTGGLHLDGLADTADGVFSHRSGREALRIMKDSHIGTMGVLALFFVLAVKWAGISSTQEARFLGLVLIPGYSRMAFTLAIHVSDYSRPEGGTGASFFGGNKGLSGLRWVPLPIGLSLLTGSGAILLNLAFVAILAIIVVYCKKRFGGFTGDMLGALGEVTEAALFLLMGAGR